MSIPGSVPGKAIEAFVNGNEVLSGTPDKSGKLTWKTDTVEFSHGTGPDAHEPEMMFFTYDLEGAEHTLTITADHVFFQPDGTIVRARRLNVGDLLVLGAGGTTPVKQVSVKSYDGGIWNIATSIDKPENLDGHLLTMGGVVCGDYALQIFYDDLAKRGLTGGNSAAEFGSADYNNGAGADALPSRNLKEAMSDFDDGSGVFLHTDHGFTLDVDNAHGFLTPKQADELERLVAHKPVLDSAQISTAEWLLRLYSGFYPQVNFILDWPNKSCNAFTVYLDETPTVIVQGGLARTIGLEWQGLALIIAQCIGRVGPNNTLVCKAEADYGVVAPLQAIYYPLYPNVIFDAFSQIEKIFGRIPTKKDMPDNNCHETTLECRIATYRDSIAGLPMPACAGGAGNDPLKVDGANGLEDATALVDFNQAVEIASAEQIENYDITPAVNLTSAKVKDGIERKVSLVGSFRRNVEYTVTVNNVRSAIWSNLDPKANSADFKIPKKT